MNFNPTDRLKISSEVLAQHVNDETVLLDLEGEFYFGLSKVGTGIWQLIQAETTIQVTLDTRSGEYDVSREQLASDVGDLPGKLAKAGLNAGLW